MAAETLGMIELPINEIIKRIKKNLQFGIYDPVIILGKMGMGKTASLKGLAKELGIGYCELRLVNMTETDMLGIPTISSDGTTTYASNDLLPIEERDGEVGILALDEITSCSRTMRAAAYQLLDDQRRLGNYRLPDKWIAVGLGNGPDDGGVFNGSEPALFTRAVFNFRVAPNLEAWKSWAIPRGINNSIVAYLTYDPSKLHSFDPNLDSMSGICPTPRTWEKLSKLLNAYEKEAGGLIDPTEVSVLAAASIGVAESGSFAGFYEYNRSKNLIKVSDILGGKADATLLIDIEPQVMYLTLSKLINEVENICESDSKYKTMYEYSDDTYKKISNAVNWLIDLSRHRLDYSILGIKDLGNGSNHFTNIATSDKFSEFCPRFDDFCNAHYNVS